jgi:hypothetical protein
MTMSFLKSMGAHDREVKRIVCRSKTDCLQWNDYDEAWPDWWESNPQRRAVAR